MDELRTDKPEAGETILFCGHFDEDTYHFFDRPGENEGPEQKPQIVEVKNSKGDEFKIRWIILCDDCTRQRTKYDGVYPFDGVLHKAVWGPDELQLSEHGKN